MKICTIIAEYDPLHTGHKRLIDFAKQHADVVAVAMSGNFTQRGMPAVADKYTRAVHAIKAGADVVLEIPTSLVVGGAENFSHGAVSVAKAIRSDFLCFGSENGNLQTLQCVADTLAHTSQSNETVKRYLKQGFNYPTAVAKAYPQFAEILDKPNNLLAVQYLAVAKEMGFEGKALTLKRENGFGDLSLQNVYASSTAIRKALASGIDCTVFLPVENQTDDLNIAVENAYKKYATVYVSANGISPVTEGVAEGIENRFDKIKTDDYDQMIDFVKTKRYTQLRLQRIILASVLGITKDVVAQAKQNVATKILAVRKEKADEILSYLGQKQIKVVKTTESIDTVDKKADDLYFTLSGTVKPQNLIKV